VSEEYVLASRRPPLALVHTTDRLHHVRPADPANCCQDAQLTTRTP
jgi:hypothetical protein